MIEAGAFRDRVEIQTRTAASGPFHSGAGEWEISATRWCRRVPISTQYAMVLAQRGHDERAEWLVFRGELEIDIANTRFVLGDLYYRAIEPPEVRSSGRTSRVLISQEVQR
ncbi:MAG: hypothetical protein PHE72_14695 [candidate division Zixibacteria bacterium]|nr:hypothetical protein [candidate division Zixibacteria bacterium]